jgi:Holliday junction DNA helicase RuvA
MIASLRGSLQHLGDGELVMEVGGVGLKLAVPHSVIERAPAIGQPLFLFTELIVREDSLRLIGFSSTEERETFDLLLQVSGIGPRLALAILSHLSLETLHGAVTANQPELLTQVPGIGRKTAEKIIFQLKDRLPATQLPAPIPTQPDLEVVAVLTGLGYNLTEAQAAVQSLPRDGPESIEERIRLALQHFARP